MAQAGVKEATVAVKENDEKPHTSSPSKQDSHEEPANNVVQFDDPNDPDNPRNWSSTRKWAIVCSASLTCLLAPMSSSIVAPSAPTIVSSLTEPSSILSTLLITIFLFGYAIGPLLLSPLSEIYGRLPVVHISNTLFIIFTVVCAVSHNIGLLIAFRFFAGAAASYIWTVSPGIIADLFVQEERGRPVSIWALGLSFGPSLGPICGGFMADAVDWRWELWVIAIAAGLALTLSIVFLRETFPPLLLERKAAKLRKETGNDSYQPAQHTGASALKTIRTAFVRPVLIARQPIVMLLSLYNAFVYSLLYLFISDIALVFDTIYGFSLGISGLTYVGLGLGMLGCVIACGFLSDKLLKRQAAKRAGGRFMPEDRLLPMIILGSLAPAGLFIFGWSARFEVFWFVPVLGTTIAAIGILPIFLTIPAYLIDAFPLYAASANTVLTVFRSTMAAFLPLAGPSLYDNLGQGWANSVLAFITIAFIPAPWLFYKYGEQIREHPRFKVSFERGSL